MIFDVTKVTYSTYSCTINGMSREMMKMDIIGILYFDFKSQSDKIVYSASSPLNQKPKN